MDEIEREKEKEKNGGERHTMAEKESENIEGDNNADDDDNMPLFIVKVYFAYIWTALHYR